MRATVRARPSTIGIAASADFWKEAAYKWHAVYLFRVKGGDPVREANMALDALRAENSALEISGKRKAQVIRRLRRAT